VVLITVGSATNTFAPDVSSDVAILVTDVDSDITDSDDKTTFSTGIDSTLLNDADSPFALVADVDSDIKLDKETGSVIPIKVTDVGSLIGKVVALVGDKDSFLLISSPLRIL